MNILDNISKFLEKTSDTPKLIVIYGPTGAGKTDMSIEIAKYLGTEIISTDSRQIYRGMDIGTGKITQEEMQGITHHMLDIIDPDQEFSAGDFAAKSIPIIERLHNSGKIPMLVGGTGLYINSLIFDYSFPKVPADRELRKSFESLSNEELYKNLQDIDPEYAEELHLNNRPYVERALEVKILTGKSKTAFRREKKLKYDVLFLTPSGPHLTPLPKGEGISYREWLYERINRRVEKMFEIGLEEEVKKLISQGYGKEAPGMKSIGYAEFFPYLRGKISREDCMAKIQQHSRNYAKRQLTWFRAYERYKVNV